jgi:hypothetical protein
MKKLLLVLAIGAFVACNDNAGTGETKADTTAAPSTVDTAATAPVDTTAKPMDTTAAKPADTTIKK